MNNARLFWIFGTLCCLAIVLTYIRVFIVADYPVLEQAEEMMESVAEATSQTQEEGETERGDDLLLDRASDDNPQEVSADSVFVGDDSEL